MATRKKQQNREPELTEEAQALESARATLAAADAEFAEALEKKRQEALSNSSSEPGVQYPPGPRPLPLTYVPRRVR